MESYVIRNDPNIAYIGCVFLQLDALLEAPSIFMIA
jgi:hypothetical protein